LKAFVLGQATVFYLMNNFIVLWQQALLIDASVRRGQLGSWQQLIAQNYRKPALSMLDIPTFVIHGDEDHLENIGKMKT
jgi:hypothetical protein